MSKYLFKYILIVTTSIAFAQQVDPAYLYGPLADEMYIDYDYALKDKDYVSKLSITDTDLSMRIDKLGKLTNLYVLNLKNNQINYFPDELCILNNLHYLSTTLNPIQNIPQCIGQLKQLKEFKLYHTQISSLPKSFGILGSLKKMEIQSNLTTLNLDSIYGGLTSLQSILVYNTPLKAFPAGINLAHNLESITLVKCKLSDVHPSLFACAQLKELILDNNQLKEFPFALINLKQLQHLSLRNNQITSIPEQIAEMSNLKLLELGGNTIHQHDLEIIKVLLPDLTITFN